VHARLDTGQSGDRKGEDVNEGRHGKPVALLMPVGLLASTV
jgi:hypothetical protein